MGRLRLKLADFLVKIANRLQGSLALLSPYERINNIDFFSKEFLMSYDDKMTIGQLKERWKTDKKARDLQQVVGGFVVIDENNNIKSGEVGVDL